MIWRIALFVVSFLFLRHRLRIYLRFLQQEEYNARRFLKWLWKTRAYDRKATLVALAGVVLAWLHVPISWLCIFASVLLVLIVKTEPDPRVSGKLMLQMTTRAKRIYRWAQMLVFLALVLVWPLSIWLGLILLVQTTPLFLLVAIGLLHRDEKRRQERFIVQAKSRLAAIEPFVIGITGSYGKTSTKLAIGQLLQVTMAPTFWPKKGVNTPMGITKEIRNELKAGHEFAVIEMGAYGPGSIRRLCNLTPPSAGIITAIGKAHLERFGSQEVILHTKSELAQAIPAHGILVCNGDCVGSRKIATTYPKETTLLYGIQNRAVDCRLTIDRIDNNGTRFHIDWDGSTYPGLTPLIGQTALLNLAGAFTMSVALGADPEYAVAAMAALRPMSNRLELKQSNGATYLHDAYNSNPLGFRAALETMRQLPGKRRIVVTPGFIELGSQQWAEHVAIGQLVAKECDVALVVGGLNREALLEGLQQGGLHKERVHLFNSRDEALEMLQKMQRPDDIILIENDLPDLYEAKVRL